MYEAYLYADLDAIFLRNKVKCVCCVLTISILVINAYVRNNSETGVTHTGYMTKMAVIYKSLF